MPLRVALGSLAILALVASVANSNGQPIGEGGLSYAFRDDLWVGGRPTGSQVLTPRLDRASLCALRARVRSCVTIIYRDERLGSNTSDTPANGFVDLTGHVTGVSGMIVVEHSDDDAFAMISGDVSQWSVIGEKVLDEKASALSGTDPFPLGVADPSSAQVFVFDRRRGRAHFILETAVWFWREGENRAFSRA